MPYSALQSTLDNSIFALQSTLLDNRRYPMALSPQDAARALDDIAETGTQTRRFLGYQGASIFFFLWGVLLMVANGLSDIDPARTSAIWITTDVVGIAIS